MASLKFSIILYDQPVSHLQQVIRAIGHANEAVNATPEDQVTEITPLPLQTLKHKEEST